MEQNYTSLELSKRLAENGCNLQSKCGWYKIYDKKGQIVSTELVPIFDRYDSKFTYMLEYYSFSILNNICVEYCKEFFGEKLIRMGELLRYEYRFHTREILYLMQRGKKQEAEEYIWNNCLFNKQKV